MSFLIPAWRVPLANSLCIATPRTTEFYNSNRVLCVCHRRRIAGHLRRAGTGEREPLYTSASGLELDSVRVTDVSRAARGLRWMRAGSRLQAVLAVGLLVLATGAFLQSFAPNVRPEVVGELRQMAGIESLLAAISAFVSLGYAALAPIAALVSLFLFALPLSVLGVAVIAIVLSTGGDLSDAVAPALFSLVGLCLAYAAVRAFFYCRTASKLRIPATLPGNPFQRRLFQSRRNARGVVVMLALTATAPVVSVLAYAAALVFIPSILPAAVRPDMYDTSLTYLVGVLDYPMTMVGATVVAFATAALCFFRAMRYARAGAAELRSRDPRTPILFLRSFADDEVRFETWLRGKGVTLDEDITDALALYGPVIALARPGEKLAPLGSAREHVPHAQWRERAAALIDEAQAIVVVLGVSAGLRWELEHITKCNATRKLFLVIPPLDGEQVIARWNVATAIMPTLRLVPQSTVLAAVVVGIDDEGQAFAVTSRTQKEADYFEGVATAVRTLSRLATTS